jgi:hypothetical protein
MVLVNGTKFSVYDIDTVDSLIIRIASNLSTIPSYMYFPNEKPSITDISNEQYDIIFVDILNDVKRYAEKGNIIDVFDNISSAMLSEINLSYEKDIIPLFFAYNTTMKGLNENMKQAYYFSLKDTISQKLNTRIDLTKVNEASLNLLRTNLTKRIEMNKKKSKEMLKNFKQFQDVSSTLSYTPFDIEKVTFSFNLNIQNISLIEIFNSIILNKYIPFATINGFFKLSTDFTPSLDWIVKYDDLILLKMCEKTCDHIRNQSQNEIVQSNIDQESDYTDIVIEYVDNIIKITTSINVNKNISKNDCIDRIISIFNKNDLVAENIIDERITGVFYFPKMYFENVTFTDICMNNPIFSQLLYINESINASKIKNNIYIYFSHQKTGNITANVSQHVLEVVDLNKFKNNDQLINVGETYVKIKTSATNIKYIVEFQKLMAKLFVIYENNLDELVSVYKMFIPTFKYTKPSTTDETEYGKNRHKLKYIEPDIFIEGYPKSCANPPIIIEDNEVEKFESDGYQIMTFPREDEGLRSRKYVCTHPKKKYPGLRINLLPNKNKYKYLPCCTAVDQSLKKGSVYRSYYFDEDMENYRSIQHGIIVTQKLLINNQLGIIPIDILRFFDTFKNDMKYDFYRKGVFRTPSSFLNCIVNAFDDDFSVNDNSIDLLKDIRVQLANYPYLCKQEMYDYSLKEIRDYILDNDKYLDPRLFISLLETKYDCNIYMFEKSDEYPDGNMIIPRFTQQYYQRHQRQRKQSVFIFEHRGNANTKKEYPQCELIARFNNTDQSDTKYVFEGDSDISKNIYVVYNDLLRKFSVGSTNTISDVSSKDGKYEIIGQKFDSYGKCRVVNVKCNGIKFTIKTPPLKPYNVPELKHEYRLSKKDLMTVLKKLNVSLDRSVLQKCVYKKDIDPNINNNNNINQNINSNDNNTIDNLYVSEVECIFGNVKCDIIMEDGVELIKSIKNHVILNNYNKNHFSYIEQFKYNKKMARYMVEYMLWLLSIYIHDNSIDIYTISEDAISKFIDKTFILIPDFQYGNVNKYLSMTNGLMYDNRIVVKSEETRQRMIYVLELSLKRDIKKILKYYKLKNMENYYIEISDFDVNDSQVIIEGVKAVYDWVDQKNIKDDMKYTICPHEKYPYFLTNKVISKNVVMIQNIKDGDLYDCLYVCSVWNEKGYNVSMKSYNNPYSSTNFPSYTMNVYINDKDIRVNNIDGTFTPTKPINVISYVTNEVVVYSSVLDI